MHTRHVGRYAGGHSRGRGCKRDVPAVGRGRLCPGHALLEGRTACWIRRMARRHRGRLLRRAGRQRGSERRLCRGRAGAACIAALLDADSVLVQAGVRRDMERQGAVGDDRVERARPLRPADMRASRRLARTARAGTVVERPIAASQCPSESPARLPAAMEFLRLRPVNTRRPAYPRFPWHEGEPLPAAGRVDNTLHATCNQLRAETGAVAAALALPPARLDALVIPGETAVQGVLKGTRGARRALLESCPCCPQTGRALPARCARACEHGREGQKPRQNGRQTTGADSRFTPVARVVATKHGRRVSAAGTGPEGSPRSTSTSRSGT